jgi:choline dehydrogenase-like flavoprotein
MSGRHHGAREADATQDSGSRGRIPTARRAGLRRALRRTPRIWAQPTRQGDGARAHQARELARRVAKGRLKAAEKIGAAAARVLARNHGHRYYDWAYEDGVFRFFEHPVHFTREQAYEGKYVIQTEEPNLSAVDAVRLYKELSEVERAFADLKDVLELRPIYHQIDSRVQAHIYVAALAFLLHRAIEKKLKAARLDLSATEALTALKSVRVVDINLGDGPAKRSVTTGTNRAAAVLRALGITEVVPSTPPQPGETVM